jgi:subtilisin-like proprotein convertase family protein
LFPIVYQSNAPLDSLTVFSNTTAFTVTDRAGVPPIPPGVATLYPSPIVVSGLVGTVSDVNVTLLNVTAARPRDLDLLLVGPTGASFVIMADAGELCPIAGVNITLDDGAANALPNPLNGCPPDAPISTGSWRPANYPGTNDPETYPAPAPAGPYNLPAPAGVATFATVFNGSNPNGTWNLYVVDDSQGGTVASFAGGWSIDITAVGGVDPTTTGIVSNLNPSLTTQNVTFTSTTTNNTTASPIPAGAGTVNFTNNGVTIPGCGAVAIVAGGQAQCTVMLAEGTRNIVANYSGTATLGLSSGSLTQTVNFPTSVTGAQFCNNGGITVVDGTIASPVYPSTVTVSNLFGTVSSVTATLSTLSAPRTGNLDFLLVGPTGATFEMMSDAGDNTTPVSINLTLSDAAATLLPGDPTVLTTGTFRPADYAPAGNVEAFPAPAPAAPYNAPTPSGASTFTTVYGTTNPNGNWRLFAADDGIGGGNTTVAGWCLNFTLTPFATTTTVTSSANPSIVGQPVTFTATVSSGAGTPTGNVEFLDGAVSLGVVALNGAGQAQVTTSALTAATHTITANYLGATVGSGGGGIAIRSNTVAGGPVVSNSATWEGSSSGDWHTPANWATNFVPAAVTLNIDIPAAGVTNNPVITTSDVTVANLTIGGTRTLTIGAGRTLTANGIVGLGTGRVIGAGLLSLGTAATITHGAGGQVESTLRKNFAGPGPSFEMPVGTVGVFSPLNVLVSLGSGQLTARANTGMPVVMPIGLDPLRTLQRYWTLSGSGIRSNVTFNYVNGDVLPPPNDETQWAIIRVTGNTAIAYTSAETYVVMDPANNRFTMNDLESYSDWTAGIPLAPTAANANISGRVTNANGRGIYGARVALQDQEGHTVYAITNPFGYYRFLDVPGGQTYLLSVTDKRYQFAPRTLNLVEDVADVDFTPVSGGELKTSDGAAKQPVSRGP